MNNTMKAAGSLIMVLFFFFNAEAQDQITNAGNMRIHPGTSITFFGNFNNNGSAVDVGQPVTFNKDVILNSGSSLTAGTVTISVGGNWTNNIATFTPNASTVVFNGTGAQLINGTAASQTFNHVIVSKTAGTLLSLSGNTTTLATNNFTETSGNFTAPATMNIITAVTSSLTLTAGTFTAGIITNLTGNWTNNGGTFTPGSNLVVFNGSAAQAINGTAASQTFYNLTLNKTAGTLLSTAGSTTTVTTQDFTETTGDFTAPATFNINGNNTLTAGTFTAGTTINIAGNWTNNGGTFTPGSNLVVFNGSSPQAINGSAVAQTFYNVTVAKTAGVLLNTGGSTVTLTTQNLTGTTGKFTAPATLNINGNYLLSAGTFTAGTLINIAGNWTTNGGTFTPGTNTVNFNGTGTKTLGGTVSTSFYKLTLNTVLATDIVQLTKNTIVTSVLNLTKGELDLNSRSISITSGLTGAITRTSGFILSEKTNNSSQVIWSIGNNLTSHTFPFGTVAGSYIPFIMNLTAGDIGNVTLSTYPTAATNNIPFPTTPVAVTNLYGSNGVDNSANVVDRFWQIDKDGVSGTATITFTATAAEVGSILLPTAQRYESSTNKWQQAIPGQTITATSATVPGVTTFSPWTMSSQSQMLPIELVSFNAVYTNPFVSLTWVTESEINSDYYTIERTTDEKTFETVGEIKAAGESMQTLNYQTADKDPLPGLSYYRLKQSDLDGKISYSDLVAVQITAAEQISIFPNPVTNGMITIHVPNHSGETLGVSILDMNGNIHFANENKLGDAPQSSIIINDLNSLPKGMYVVRISSASEIISKKITIY